MRAMSNTEIAMADAEADTTIKVMVSAVVAAAIIPAHVSWAVVAGAMGVGVSRIGLCYGVELDKGEGWQLVKQFVCAAGFTWTSIAMGSRVFAVILASTPLSYAVAAAMDAAMGAAFSYAIGGAAKAYFKGERDKATLGRIVREVFKQKRN